MVTVKRHWRGGSSVGCWIRLTVGLLTSERNAQLHPWILPFLSPQHPPACAEQAAFRHSKSKRHTEHLEAIGSVPEGTEGGLRGLRGEATEMDTQRTK